VISYLQEREHAVDRHREEETDTINNSKRYESVSYQESAQVIQDWLFAKYNRDCEEDNKGNEVESIPWRES